MVFIYPIDFVSAQTISGLEDNHVSSIEYITDSKKNKSDNKRYEILYVSKGTIVSNKEAIVIASVPEVPKERVTKRIAKGNMPKNKIKRESQKVKITKLQQTTAFKSYNQDNRLVTGTLNQQDFGILINARQDTLQKAIASNNVSANTFLLSVYYMQGSFGLETHYKYGTNHSAFSSRPPPVISA